MTLYGQRPGETYRDPSGRLIHEPDEHMAYRTDRSGSGLWIVSYHPHTPGGFRERQVEGTTQFQARSVAEFRLRLGRRLGEYIPDTAEARA